MSGKKFWVVSTLTSSVGKVASVGRVLGDRSTLYKYINPHLIAVATVASSRSAMTIYAIDAVTGSLIWQARHEGDVDTTAPISIALTENWLVYAFSEKGPAGGHTRIVSTEMYEDKQRGEAFSSYAREKLFTTSQSFLFPARITALATSQTLHGVSSKALLGEQCPHMERASG